jgi:branched-chain amino acid transport system substrate-binding protein
MEIGLKQWLAEHNNMMAGRKVELTIADTGGVPANTKTKISELYERNKIHALMGPLAAFEALAVDDYIKALSVVH